MFSKYDILQPRKYKDKWLIFSDSIFSNIDTVDCDNTIFGECYNDKSLEQCIEICGSNKYDSCGAGYYIRTKKENICVPLRTDVNPQINPVNRLRRKDLYPSLNNIQIDTFINTEKFPFPPNKANVVFMGDTTLLQSVDNFQTMKKVNINILTPYARFSKGGDQPINILPAKQSAIELLRITPLQFGEKLIFTLPGTSLILRSHSGRSQSLEWVARFAAISQKFDVMQIMPLKDKKIGNFVTYDDNFYILYSENQVVGLNEYNELFLFSNTYENLKANGFKVTFTFKTLMDGYYCEDEKCKSIPISQTQSSRETATYKGKMVTRNPGCYGLCRYIKSIHAVQYEFAIDKYPMGWRVVIFILIIALIVSAVVIYARYRG